MMVSVRGYERRDGTRVRAYERSRPGGSGGGGMTGLLVAALVVWGFGSGHVQLDIPDRAERSTAARGVDR